MPIFASEMSPLIAYIESSLQGVVPLDDLRSTAFYIAEEVTGLSRTDILCGKGTINSANEQLQLDAILQRVCNHEPLQYIFGTTDWRGMRLQVTPAVLIPRPETAELVDWVLEEGLKVQTFDGAKVRVVDAGTGSGCIAIALKKAQSDWDVTAIDVSQDALQVAQQNAQTQGVAIQFQLLDLLTQPLPQAEVIVSNPPYIRPIEQADMSPNVLEHEPHTALFVPEHDPLLFYRRIAEQHAARFLFFEINQYLAQETTALLEQLGYEVTLRKDIFGNPRMIKAQVR